MKIQLIGKSLRFIENIIGFKLIRKQHLPIGVDLLADIKYKLKVDVNVVFDVGANVGKFTKKINELYPKAKIHCFEPITATYVELSNNFSNNDNVICNKLALGEKLETIRIGVFPDSMSVLNSLLPELMGSDNEHNENININTIDNYLQVNTDIKVIDLLKIDTEGYDLKVIDGAIQSIGQSKINMIFIEVGLTKDDKRHLEFDLVYSKMKDFGFSLFGLYDLHIKNYLGNYHYCNALFIKN